MSAMLALAVPLRANDLGATLDVIGLIVGGGLLAPAILSVSLGAVVDRAGAKASFLVGTGVTALATASMVLVQNYWWFLLLVPIAATAISMGWVASQAYITGLATGARQVTITGRFSFFGTIGQMVGPLFAGLSVELLGFRWGLLGLSLYALVYLGDGLLLREGAVSSGESRPEFGLKQASRMFAIAAMRVALILTGTRLWISYIFATFVPLYLVTEGVTAGEAGVVVAVSGLVGAVLAPAAGRLASRAPADLLVVGGLLCGATGLVLTPLVPIGPLVYVIPLLVGIGRGLSLPLLLSIVSSAAPEGQRGVALGLRATVNHLSSALAPSAIGPAMSLLGVTLGFAAGGGVAMILLVIGIGVRARAGSPVQEQVSGDGRRSELR